MADSIKLTEKSAAVFGYVRENGGRVSVDELCTALDKAPRSINANITDLVKKGLVLREKVAGDGEDAKEITYVVLTEAGHSYMPDAE